MRPAPVVIIPSRRKLLYQSENDILIVIFSIDISTWALWVCTYSFILQMSKVPAGRRKQNIMPQAVPNNLDIFY